MPDITTPLFEARLEATGLRIQDPCAGVFGPDSLTWQYTRESMLFAGSWRAVLLQLAHPWVSRAIEEHSDSFRDPVGRFHRTFRVVWSMVFGDWERVQHVSRGLHRQHQGVTGEVTEASPHFPSGSGYRANQQEALAWVYATLIDTTVVVQELLRGPLPEGEKARYYRESLDFAALFGIDPSQLPADWTAFRAWWDAQLQDDVLHVTDAARDMADHLFVVPQLLFSRWWGPVARTCTAEIMPAPLREAYGLPASSPAIRRTLERNVRRLRVLRSCLPRGLRYVPAYHEACARRAGRTRAPWLTRRLSHAWLGVPELVIGSSA